MMVDTTYVLHGIICSAAFSYQLVLVPCVSLRFCCVRQGYLAHHHDMIVLTAVDETRRAAAECSLVRQREWEVDSWRQTKKVR